MPSYSFHHHSDKMYLSLWAITLTKDIKHTKTKTHTHGMTHRHLRQLTEVAQRAFEQGKGGVGGWSFLRLVTANVPLLNWEDNWNAYKANLIDVEWEIQDFVRKRDFCPFAAGYGLSYGPAKILRCPRQDPWNLAKILHNIHFLRSSHHTKRHLTTPSPGAIL